MENLEKIGIVIPVYNESSTISLLINEIKSSDYLKNEFSSFEILVVDDGSEDETPTILKKCNEISTITHGYNMGVGAAVRSGLKYFEKRNFDYVVKIDADKQHEVDEINLLVDPLKKHNADLVYGDRFKGGLEYKMPKYRLLGNKFFTYTLNKITKYKISDSQPGFFAGNKYFLKNFYILTNYNYTQQVLYSSYLAGLKFTQVPITFRERVHGESFIKFSYPVKALFQILLMILIKKPLSIFGNSGIISIFLALIMTANQLINFFNGSSSKPIENVNFVLGFGIAGLIFLITALILKSIQNLDKIERNKT